jgi:hypothetical protein
MRFNRPSTGFLKPGSPSPPAETPVVENLASAGVRTRVSNPSNFYCSILRVIEDFCSLPDMGKGSLASRIAGIWN